MAVSSGQAPSPPPKCAKVSRGFVLHSSRGEPVTVAFNASHGLELRQGNDFILISNEDVEVFKRGMTWVREEVLNSNT